ncbi:SRPBCC family protein [Nocardioides sp. SR21]|uniref:SRPBCC family protein n=1 Tax=Nocardioides sp. SR21 TaxID=2919501 RepID=UPI001FAA8C36|nr:SRPBCC family protein [Nocardioides sp. SR21]
MATNTRVMKATPDQVWDVLADGWLYPLWVVGASRMREVDTDWPTVGSQLHHSVGSWPLLIDDTTEVAESAPGRSLALRARAWPTGAAGVRITLEPADDGHTRVVIEEDAISGPALLVPRLLRDPGLKWRNVESLRRLAYLAERRSARG